MLRDPNMPMFAKYIGVVFLACFWKWFYYAPNTYKELKLAQMRRKGQKIPDGVNPAESVTIKGLMMGQGNFFYSLSELMAVVLLPYLAIHFFITPLPYLFLCGDVSMSKEEHGRRSVLVSWILCGLAVGRV